MAKTPEKSRRTELTVIGMFVSALGLLFALWTLIVVPASTSVAQLEIHSDPRTQDAGPYADWHAWIVQKLEEEQ